MTKSQTTAASPCFDFRSMPFTSETTSSQKSGNNACTLFQPLYHPGSDGGNNNPDDHNCDPAALLEAAHQKGLHDGRQSGCEEAWGISTSSLRPALRDYAQAVHSLCTLNEHIQEDVSANIIELALTIVRQILGEEVYLTSEALSGLKKDFGQALAQVNRFALKIHPDDVSELQAILAADNMTWPDHPGLCIEEDPALHPGDLFVGEPVSREKLPEKMKEQLVALLTKLR